MHDDISDGEIVAAAVSFDATPLRLCPQDISGPHQFRDYGGAIGRARYAGDLAGVCRTSSDIRTIRSMSVAAARATTPLSML
jgi:hypothetical protein